MIFDPPSALPTATLVPKTRGLALLAGLERWLLARWSWLEPRTVPVAVAVASMILMIIAADGLLHAGFTGIGHPPHEVGHHLGLAHQ